MDAYFSFVSSNAFLRIFFALLTAVDLVFVYAVLFDRDLPRRMAVRFFGVLSRQPVTIDQSAAGQKNNWLVFAVVSAVPPAAWIVFECCFAGRNA